MKLTKLHCAVLTALAASGSLYAEEAKKQTKAQIEIIEVTATKRAESIQEVPVTVTALTGDSLEKLGVSNFDQYVEFLPNVVFQGTGPGQNEIYIRGAATTQTSIAVSSVQALQPSVAFYLDEQPVSMQGRNLDIYATDIERIEVLPGPQGTLFGASSQSGTVRLITNKPTHDGFAAGFDTSTSTTKGGDLSNSVEAYFNMSLTDSLAVRVTAYNDHQGGWIDNILNVPGEGGYIGSAIVIDRVSASWGALANPANTPTTSPQNDALVEENFNTANYAGARFGLSYLINDEWNLLVQHTQQSLDTEGVFAYDPNLEGETSTNRFTPENNNDDFGLTTWTLAGRLEHLDIVYTGGYLDRDINSTIDYTGYTNGGLFSTYYVCNYAAAADVQVCLDPTKFYKEATNTSRITHELRMNTSAENRWRVTAGVFYDSQEVATVGQFKIANTELYPDLAKMLPGTDGINSNGGPFSSEVSFINDVTHTIDQIAVFGQLEFDITDTVTASFGARWYQIDDMYKGSTSTVDVSGRLQAFGDGSVESLTEFFGATEAAAIQDAIASGQLETSLLDSDGTLTVDDTIIKASLDWKVSDNIMLFTSYSEGFRPPVTNRVGGGLADTASEPGAFENYRIPVYSTTDSLDNIEIGFKSTLFDQSLRFNATAYYSKISDLQTSRFDPANISFLVFTDNVGEAKIKGIDGDFTWVATDNLIISGAFSFIDSELTSINDQLIGIAPTVGSRLPYSAEFSGNLQAQYFFLIAKDMTGYINGSISYTGERLAGMVMDAYVTEDSTQLIYGTGSGLSIEKEAAVYSGVGYQDSNGETFEGGRYIQDSYVLANLSVGVTNDEWKAELFIDNVTDESAILYIDTQQFTPKVVSNRPRTVGFRFSYDFY